MHHLHRITPMPDRRSRQRSQCVVLVWGLLLAGSLTAQTPGLVTGLGGGSHSDRQKGLYNVSANRQLGAAADRNRPSLRQIPTRDLKQREIRRLSELDFHDSNSVGVKAANLAAMHHFGFPKGTIPNGFAVPFSFYDEFMKHNGFYDVVEMLLHHPEFRRSEEQQQRELKKLRSLIKKGKFPGWMLQALTQVAHSFPHGTSIRCRSSTNNEDLPNFSGSGLYDSYTHHPHEGHLSKSVKQVFASLWNYRAFRARELARVDHLSAAMGVLMHPNFGAELANGMAVTVDVVFATPTNYYLKNQIGEGLVANPKTRPAPEELLLAHRKEDGYEVLRRQTGSSSSDTLLTESHLDELRQRLARVHSRFRKLYGKDEDEQFAVEIEYKITQAGKLAIKQARPWVFSSPP